MKSIHLIVLLAVLAVVAGMGQAANVISASPDHRFDINTVPPPGAQGYVFYATGATPGHDVASSSAVGISTGTLSSPVSYVTIDTTGDQFLGSADAGNTRMTIAGSTVTTGMAYQTPVGGPTAQLATITLGPGTPGIIRLGILVDNAGGVANDTLWPIVTGINGTIVAPTNGNNPPRNDFDLSYLIDARPGDVIPVAVTHRADGTNAALGGFTFDLPVPGDANLDGKVDFADLLILAQNYGSTTNVGWRQGDFNGDGKVTFADLLVLAQHYGQTIDNLPVPQFVQVPDPSGAPLLLAAALYARCRKSPASS
jgi:hypothetical protein